MIAMGKKERGRAGAEYCVVHVSELRNLACR